MCDGWVQKFQQEAAATSSTRSFVGSQPCSVSPQRGDEVRLIAFLWDPCLVSPAQDAWDGILSVKAAIIRLEKSARNGARVWVSGTCTETCAKIGRRLVELGGRVLS